VEGAKDDGAKDDDEDKDEGENHRRERLLARWKGTMTRTRTTGIRTRKERG
jgi:hypothetical protein